MRLENAFRAALSAAEDQTVPPTTVREISQLYGGNSQLAQALSGTSDKKSTAYKTAMRNVQRYQKEGGQSRKPKPEQLKRLSNLAQQKVRDNARQEMREKGVKVEFKGYVTVSPDLQGRGDERYREPPEQHISGEEMDKVLTAWEDRRRDDAMSDFEEAFFEEYGIGQVALMTDVAELNLTVE